MTKDDLRRYGSIRRELADITRRLHALEESKGCHGVTYGDSLHQRGEPLSEAQRYVEKKETLERLYRESSVSCWRNRQPWRTPSTPCRRSCVG
ncbi:MAG: hypothetical protein ACLUSL_13055 [Ruminococcus sp.]